MAGKSKKFSVGKTVLFCALALIVGFVAAFFAYSYIRRETGGDRYVVEAGDNLAFYFMELGNKYAGDSIYIKAGDTDILIDAGSRASSTETTAAFIDQFCTDGFLEYVIATHADRDHIAGFAGSSTYPSIFERYECGVIIDFPRTNSTTQTYQTYIEQRDAEVAAGAEHYTALECYNNENGARRVYELAAGVKMEILYNYYYEHSSADENNYSVCLLFSYGDEYFLFTGDLEEEGEKYLVQYNDLPEVELFKAGHHGSKTSSTDALLSVIRPKIVCVCCCAGTDEYTDTPENQFPTQAMIDRVAKYTDRVYVTTLGVGDSYTSMNGNIAVIASPGGVRVECGMSDTLLKDTEWFKENRTTPPEWQS